jgi:hypothetical protein
MATNPFAELDLGPLSDGWQTQGMIVRMAPAPNEQMNITYTHEPRGGRTLEAIVAQTRQGIKGLRLPGLRMAGDVAASFAGLEAHRFEVVHKADARGRLLLRLCIVAVSELYCYNITATAPEAHGDDARAALEKLLSQVTFQSGGSAR